MAASFPEAARTALGTCTRPACSCGDARANVKSHLIRSPSRRQAVVLWVVACSWRATKRRQVLVRLAPRVLKFFSRFLTRNTKLHHLALQSRIIGDLSLQATGYVDRRCGDEAGVLGAQKEHHAGHIFGLAESTERYDFRSHCQELLAGDCRAH